MSLEDKLINEFKYRVFNVNYSKIFKCFSSLNEEQLWRSPNKNIAPIGNQILHLCGNINQWILHGIGNETDKRKREDEFKKQINIRKSDLIFLLQHIKVKVETILNEINKSELNNKKLIGNKVIDGASILCYVMQHFSYHTGQIVLISNIYSNFEEN